MFFSYAPCLIKGLTHMIYGLTGGLWNGRAIAQYSMAETHNLIVKKFLSVGV